VSKTGRNYKDFELMPSKVSTFNSISLNIVTLCGNVIRCNWFISEEVIL